MRDERADSTPLTHNRTLEATLRIRAALEGRTRADALEVLAKHTRRQGRMFCPPGRDPAAEYRALLGRRTRTPETTRRINARRRAKMIAAGLLPLQQHPSKPGRMHFARWLHAHRKRLDKTVRRNMIAALVEVRDTKLHETHRYRTNRSTRVPEHWRDLPSAHERALAEGRALARELRLCGTLSSRSLADVAFEAEQDVV